MGVFADKIGYESGNVTTCYVNPSPNWQTIQLSHTVSEEATAIAVFFNPTGQGVVYIDNIQIIPQ